MYLVPFPNYLLASRLVGACWFVPNGLIQWIAYGLVQGVLYTGITS